MEKGQICYIMGNRDIKPAEFIEESPYDSLIYLVKELDTNNRSYIHAYNISFDKKEAYKKVLGWLKDDKQEAEEAIEDLEDELDVINEAIRKLKQTYEI